MAAPIRAGGAARGVLLLAAVSISWGSILVRLCSSGALTLALYRVLFATLLIAPLGVPALRARCPTGRALAAGAGAGILLALHFATWIASLSYTTIAASTLLVSTQPVFSILLAWTVLGERPARRALAAVGVALAGILLITASDLSSGAGRLTGDLLALAGAVFAAGYLVVGRASRAAVPFPGYLMIVNAAAATGGFVLVLGGGQHLTPQRAEVPWLILMALVPHLLGHGALNWAVRFLPAYLANLTVLAEPVLASLYAWLLFSEVPAPVLYPGAVLIGAGVALAFRAESRRLGAAGAL